MQKTLNVKLIVFALTIASLLFAAGVLGNGRLAGDPVRMV